MEQEKDRIIWQMVTYFIQFHSAYHPKAETLNREDPLSLYFPKPEGKFGEHANRWLAVMVDVIRHATEIFKPEHEYTYDFKPREEWDKFNTLGEYVIYMNQLISVK